MKEEPNQKISIPYFRLIAGYGFWMFVGFLIAFVYLVSVPSKTVSLDAFSAKEEPVEAGLFSLRNQVVNYRSHNYSTGGGSLSRKLFVEGQGPIVLSPSELTGWASQNLEFGNAANSNKGVAIMLTPQSPKFEIVEDILHVAYPIKMSLWGSKFDLKILSSGDFANTSGPEFKLNQLALNSALVPFHQLVYALAKPRIIAAISAHEEAQKLQSALNMFQKIEIQNGALVLYKE